MSESDLDRIDDTIESFPLVIPRDSIDVEEEPHTFSTTTNIYTLDKAPAISVSRLIGTYNGKDVEFDQGVDYELVDDDGDGDLDSIEWLSGGRSPDDDTEFLVTYRCESIISRYLRAHDTDIDSLEDDVDDVVKSAQVDRATGQDLTLVGDIFEPLARRADRNDQEYRALLKSIVESFRGRGTVPGIKFAISAGTGIDTDNIIIDEKFDEPGYEVRISSNVQTSFVGGIINRMAEIADPSGVELLNEPIVILTGDDIILVGEPSSVIDGQTGLGGGTLAHDGSETLGGQPPSVDFRLYSQYGRQRHGHVRFGGLSLDPRNMVTPSGTTDVVSTGDVEHTDNLTVDGELEIRGDMFSRTISGSGSIYGSGTLGNIQ